MATPPKSTRRSYNVVLNPPTPLAVAIAKIILHWSHQVWLLQQVTYALLDLDLPYGRIAVKDLRPEEQVAMIEELMVLYGLKTDLNLSELKLDLRRLKNLRDLVAHGAWIKNPDTGRILIQSTSGKWQPPNAGKAVSRRIIPEAQYATAHGLETIRKGIEETIMISQALLSNIEGQLLTLPKRSSRQSVLGHRVPDRTPNTPPRRPKA
jgi:hypothetical protein